MDLEIAIQREQVRKIKRTVIQYFLYMDSRKVVQMNLFAKQESQVRKQTCLSRREGEKG